MIEHHIRTACYIMDGNCGCNNHEAQIPCPGLAIASVPIQKMEELYPPETALREGTAFPSLNMPFFITAEK